MSNFVSIPQTIVAYKLSRSSRLDQHERVLHGSWLGLSVGKISELTGIRRVTVESIRARARDELMRAGLAIPTWLSAKVSSEANDD